jgi:membrane-associated phospholipid phosphatase
MAGEVTARRWVIDRRARSLGGLVAGLGLGFLLLALSLHGAPGTGIDLAITLAVQRMQIPGFAEVMAVTSTPGFWPWDWLILGATTAGFWLAGFRRAALFLLLTPAPGLLTRTVKLLVARPRPGADLVNVASALRDFSFPSGHVVSYVSLYGFIFFLIYVLFKRSRWRTAVLWLCGLLIGLVGVSRVYLGHHWASDVLGGYALGAAYLLILIEIYRLTTIKPAAEAARSAETVENLARR